MQTLEFKLCAPTFNMWANLYLAEWDAYVTCNPLGLSILKDDFLPLFKSGYIDSYWRFRSLMQIIDLNILDLDSNCFDQRRLVAAAYYLQLGIDFEIFKREDIILNSQGIFDYIQ